MKYSKQWVFFDKSSYFFILKEIRTKWVNRVKAGITRFLFVIVYGKRK